MQLAITFNRICAWLYAWLLSLHSKKLTVSRYGKKSVVLVGL